MELEDIHMNIENRLIELIGETSGKKNYILLVPEMIKLLQI